MSDSVRPHRWQPTRVPHPRILQATLEWVAISFNAWKWSHSVLLDSSWPHGLQPTRLLHPWDFPGKSTGVGCHCLLQNIHETPRKRTVFLEKNNSVKTNSKVKLSCKIGTLKGGRWGGCFVLRFLSLLRLHVGWNKGILD